MNRTAERNEGQVLVAGIGGAGVNRLQALHERLEPACRTVALDTDARVLGECAGVETLLLGESVSHGHSAGQLTELGRRAVEADRPRIQSLLEEVRLLVMLGGLGGGTAGGAIPELARLAKSMGISTLALVTTPFEFEGEQRMELAQRSLQKVQLNSDAVALLPNQLLADAADPEALTTAEALALSDEALASGLSALAQLITDGGLVNIDFGTLRSMLRHCGGSGRFSAVTARAEESEADLVRRLTQAPQLEGGALLSSCHGALLGITGGSGLRFKTLENLVRMVSGHLPGDVILRWGVSLREPPETPLQVLLLAAETWAQPAPVQVAAAQAPKPGTEKPARKKGGKGGTREAESGQTELLFVPVQEGYFRHVERTLYQGQDLDRPSYLRKGIRLP
jgi:cell division protein FtsZ